MSRIKEWEEELVSRFPDIYRDEQFTIMVEFITILEEMGGFDEGAYIAYGITHKNIIIHLRRHCGLAFPFLNIHGQLLLAYVPLKRKSSPIIIQPNSNAIRNFLSTHWSEIFPQDTNKEGK